MLRFLKKHRKPFNKPVPPESPARQTTGIGLEYGRDAEGKHRSRKTLELIRSMRLIRRRHQIPTAEGVLGSQIGVRTGELEINNFPRRMPQPRPPEKAVATHVSVVGRNYRDRRLPPPRKRYKDEVIHIGTPQKRGASNWAVTLPISAPLRGIQRFVIRTTTRTATRAFTNLQSPLPNGHPKVVRMAGILMTGGPGVCLRVLIALQSVLTTTS